jgi:hypothetical protein
MSKSFDLSKYETIDVASLIIQHPNGNDLIGEDGLNPVVINFYGIGSKQYVSAKYKLDNATQSRSIAMLRSGKSPKADEVARDQAEFFAAVTKSIDNFPLTPIELYSNPKLTWITAQADKFLGETENFMPS